MWEGFNPCSCYHKKQCLVSSANSSIDKAPHQHDDLLCSLSWPPIRAVTGMKMNDENPLLGRSHGKDFSPSNSCLLPTRTLTPRAVAQFKPKLPRLTRDTAGLGSFSLAPTLFCGGLQQGALAHLLVWLTFDSPKQHEYPIALILGTGRGCGLLKDVYF